jgi:hypothetical protein
VQRGAGRGGMAPVPDLGKLGSRGADGVIPAGRGGRWGSERIRMRAAARGGLVGGFWDLEIAAWLDDLRRAGARRGAWDKRRPRCATAAPSSGRVRRFREWRWFGGDEERVVGGGPGGGGARQSKTF